MPIWLRNFTFKKIDEYYEKQNEKYNKQNNKLKNDSKVHRPDINPSNVYNTSIPRKK